nr:1-acyl-sn-glycerol-3-phosphate acyltransferase [Micromonospora sp. DSM 115978]
ERRRRWEAAHFSLARGVLVVLIGAARRLAGFRIEVREPPPGTFSDTDAPVLVLSRHAGSGDSFTLMYLLLTRYGRTPRVVLTARLQLDPAIDVLLHRIDGCFVGADGADPAAVTRINALASRLQHRDVMVIFPEGANFTEPRRHRLIRRLRDAGHRERADVAEEFVHVLPPRPAGVLAAFEAETCVATVIVAHTGLDRLTSADAVWAAIPLAEPLELRWWWEPADELPQSGEDRLEWLTLHWAVVDAWISSR